MMCTTSLRYRAALVPQAGCTTPTASRGGARLPASFFFMPGAWAICRVLVLVQFSHVLLAACQGSYDEHAVMHASVACAAHICCLRAEGACAPRVQHIFVACAPRVQIGMHHRYMQACARVLH